MKKSLEKLERLLQRGYRITALQYSWTDEDDHDTSVYLFNDRNVLEQIDVKGTEGFELLVYINKVLEKKPLR
ncbi:MAG: hypothetical protein NWF08_06275 [Candidatus Bathyarchaeota archaeon]|nr:hypothetical protein [Candidatus Bathyarchaeota archaeon]